MKRTVLLSILIISTLIQIINAQEGLTSCGTPETQPASIPESEKHHCFTVDDIQSNCTKLWLKINIHFFVEDNCEGSIFPGGVQYIPIEEAYKTAEDMINRANIELAENYKQWNQVEWGIMNDKPAQCVPFRYALSGVYIHCNTAGMNTGGTTANLNNFFQPTFGVNTDTEFNAYFVLHPSASGAANDIPGNAFSTSNFSTSVFNHEMGHVLRLRHSWVDDDVDDTPLIHFMYDYNCDGDLNDMFPSPGVGFEIQRRQCFFYFLDDPDRSIDYDGDGTIDFDDYCNIPDTSCARYPCCNWIFINNNIMAYSSYNECCAAYTEGQITRILENLSTDTYCNYIESISADICPPPISNIHILPNESVDDDCAYCFQIGASMHDDYYKLDFYTTSGALQHSTGWRTGPAGRYCISRSVKYATQYNHGFLPGVQYRAVLTTENDCGEEAEESITFLLPQLPAHGCLADPPRDITIKNLYPNPFTENINLEYETTRGGNLNAWLIPDGAGSDILLDTEYVSGSHIATRTYNTQNVPDGTYYLVLDFDGFVIGSIVIKI